MSENIVTECDLSGNVFSRLTVFARLKNDIWACRCECGCEKNVRGSDLIRGFVKSCGCLKRHSTTSRSLKHGFASRSKKTPEYTTWCGMISRCQNPNHFGWPRYGGRGISVCERWRDFSAFFSDMGPKPSKLHTLERVNNDGNYEPLNVVWATRKQQGKNQHNTVVVEFQGKTVAASSVAESLGIDPRKIRGRLTKGFSIDESVSLDNLNGRYLTCDGNRKTLSEWSRLTGLHITTICGRLRLGWSEEKAIKTPKRTAKNERTKGNSRDRQ